MIATIRKGQAQPVHRGVVAGQRHHHVVVRVVRAIQQPDLRAEARHPHTASRAYEPGLTTSVNAGW